MAWNNKVLDNLEQLYWSPRKLGLHSRRGNWAEDGESVIVPRDAAMAEPRVYIRPGGFEDWRAKLHRDEELLNQVLEIGFGIAPTALIARAFFAPLEFETNGPIEVVGREVAARHARLAPHQYTQHDGFYVAPDAIVGMEMKLTARTSMEQLLKYATQIALEEILFGARQNLGLIYLVPSGSVERTRHDLALDRPDMHARLWADPLAHTTKSHLRALLERHGDAVADVGRRLRIQIISWNDLLDTLLASRTAARSSGDETLGNLIEGLIAQIRATPGCGLATS